MASKQKPEKKDIISLSVHITVEGTDLEEMFLQAKIEAGVILRRSVDELYIVTHDIPEPASYPRFRQHLGVENNPETWCVTCYIRGKDNDNNERKEELSHD